MQPNETLTTVLQWVISVFVSVDFFCSLTQHLVSVKREHFFTLALISGGRFIYTLSVWTTARRLYCGAGLHYHITHVPPHPNYPTRKRKCQHLNVYQGCEVMETNSFSSCLADLPTLHLIVLWLYFYPAEFSVYPSSPCSPPIMVP